ncbi:hypothetical protein FEM48_Zijuj11G0142400 [Ziziphus jujuba var. spinosa]|uniref:CCHC-type domain-containing protein n=1 Tax=Ziziphus jujuba var. spinosa TaxID=714518 RepID=A0A978UJE9_ZIZJJ|nr:hypothetical protein FEM48_Zijuj11G0142400 [Ziziphus jujuba var. spinosa]
MHLHHKEMHRHLKLQPPSFEGSTNPLVAEDWIREMEKIFNFMECTDARKTWRDNKIAEFIELKQGKMTLAQYERKFDELSRYAPHLVDTDERKAQKFEKGLRDGLRRPILVLRLQTYGERSDGRRGDLKKVKNEQFGRMEYPTCETCGKKHPGECYRKTGACFKCGKHGHIFKNCPNIGNATQKVKRDQLTQGHVYVLTRHDAEASPSTVVGTIPISGHSAFVLMDSGSTHCFVSRSFACKLDLKPVKLDYKWLFEIDIAGDNIKLEGSNRTRFR